MFQLPFHKPMMAGLSHGPRGHLLSRFSSGDEMLHLSEIDSTAISLGRIRVCKLFSLRFSKMSYFVLDLATSSPHRQKPRLKFVFLHSFKGAIQIYPNLFFQRAPLVSFLFISSDKFPVINSSFLTSLDSVFLVILYMCPILMVCEVFVN